MKKYVLFMVAMLFIFSAFAQNVNPPAAVVTSFKKLYPGVTPTWDKEHGNYEAEFKEQGYQHSVLISEKGEVLEIEQEIPVADLPAAAKAYLEKNYPGRTVKDTEKHTDAKGRVTYKAEVAGIDDVDLVFDASGAVIREVR